MTLSQLPPYNWSTQMGLFEREDDATMTAGCNGPATSVIESESDHPSLNRMLGPHLIDERLSAVAGS